VEFRREPAALNPDECRIVCYVLIVLGAVFLIGAYSCSRYEEVYTSGPVPKGRPFEPLVPYLLFAGIILMILGFGFFCMAKQEESAVEKEVSEELG
jgi:hypothetical protein